MRLATRALLDKADRAIQAAAQLLKSGDTEFSAGRAYYAMFYVAEALLNEEGLRFKKHGGVHAAFGQHFAKTRRLHPRFHRWLLQAFSKRITGDYGVQATFTLADVRMMIRQAKEFLQAARRYLRAHAYPTS